MSAANRPDDTPLAAALREDEAARRAALDLDSCIVEAPAGAGKTELLTQRFLRLLATVAAPEEVMAITFTNKAAAEMQQRILDNLRAAARRELPEAPHKRLTFELAGAVLAASAKNGWHLLEQPGRLRVTTIDALCASLARQMPLLSRFGASPVVTDDAGPLYRDAARRTIELLESEQAEYAEPVAAALAYLDNDTGRLNHLLSAMLARRDQWLHRVTVGHDSDVVLGHLVEVELAVIRDAIDPAWEARLLPAARFAVESLMTNGRVDSPIVALRDRVEALAPTIEDLPAWRGLAEFLLTGKGEWRKSFTVAVGIPAGKEGKVWKEALAETLAAAPDGLAAVLARVRLLPGLDGREAEDEIVGHFATLLKLATAQLWSVFRESGETDFVEVAQRALDALATSGDDGLEAPSDLALRLDYQIRHLLVDEFQDTSPTQITLLERLTAGWSVGDGRTLFCVGDPMQSIYRFRKADVGLFLRAADTGIGGLPLRRLRLARNNRSNAPVVDWINQAFASIFPAADAVAKGSIAYRPSVPTRPALADAGVSVHLLEDGAADRGEDAAGHEGGGEVGAAGEGGGEELGRDEIHRAEARQILALIDATWATEPARQIAVLVRAKTHLSALVSEIRSTRPGLRFAAVDVEPLAGRQWIADLLSLSRALQHRADRVSWLALLRSPLCGLSLADLLALAGDDHRRTLWSLLETRNRHAALSDDGEQRVAVLCREVGAAFAVFGRQPFSRLVEGVWQRLGGPATLPDAAASRDVDAFFTLLAKLEARGRLSRELLDEELGRLFAAPDPDGQGRLSLMTIHKAKGLEFDTVILPGLHRAVRGNDPEMLLWDEVSLPGAAASQLVVAPMKPAVGGRIGGSSGGSGLPTAYDFLRRLERERSRNEDLRVLYVAATRAVRALHLVGVVARNDEGEALPPANTPLADLWPALSGGERLPSGIKVAFDSFYCRPHDAVSVTSAVLSVLADEPASPNVAMTGVAADAANVSDVSDVSDAASAASAANAGSAAAVDIRGGAKVLVAGRTDWTEFVPDLVRQKLAFYPAVFGAARGIETGRAAGDRAAVDPVGIRSNDARLFVEVAVDASGDGVSSQGVAGRGSSAMATRHEALIGTLVHRYLELMARDGGAWLSGRFAGLRPAVLAWLNGQGLSAAAGQSAADRVLALLVNLVGCRLGQWVLASHPGAMAEAVLLESAGGVTATAVVDRSFVDGGERWIIDYKTVALDGVSAADTVAGAAARQVIASGHRDQLARYGRLLAGDGLPQRRAILLVDGPWLVELPS